MSAYDTAVLADSPINYSQFAEASGSVAVDSSAAGVAGAYNAPFTLGQTGMGDGSTAAQLTSPGFVSLGAPASHPTGGAARTIEAIVKRTAAGVNQTLYGSQSGGSNQEFALSVGDGGCCFFSDGVNGPNNLYAGAYWPIGTFAHTVFTFDGGTGWALWINGVKKMSGSFAGPAINTGAGSALTAAQVGQRARYAGTYNLTAVVAKLAVYSGVLSDARIAAHYAQTPGYPSPAPAGLTTKTIGPQARATGIVLAGGGGGAAAPSTGQIRPR